MALPLTCSPMVASKKSMKIRPMCGFSEMFPRLARTPLPRYSGYRRVVRSRTRTNHQWRRLDWGLGGVQKDCPVENTHEPRQTRPERAVAVALGIGGGY